MAQPEIFTFALLYSNSPIKDESERQLFETVRKTIQNDKILYKGIHFICIDNKYARNLIQHNSTGVKVNSWPVFAVRNSKEKQPRLYPLYLAPMVFDHVYKLNKYFQDRASETPVWQQDWSNRHFNSGPEPGEKIRIISPSDETFHPESMQLRVEAVNPDTDENATFPWNLTAFPSDGSGRELTVRYGDELQLISTDNRAHNVTLNGKVLFPDQVGLKRILSIDPCLFKPGLNELVCTLHPNRMKLRLYVSEDQPELNELIDGMTLGSYDEPTNSKFRTFAQRQAACRDF